MARIQIADLHSENFVELTAEEQYLIQGGFWWGWCCCCLCYRPLVRY